MKPLKIILPLVIVITGFGLLLTVKLPATNPFWVETQNSGHALIFGIVALAFLSLSKTLFGTGLSTIAHYLVAFVASLAAGVLSEFMQQFLVNRDATAYDLLIDFLGIVAFLLLAWVFESDENNGLVKWKRSLKPFLVLTSLSLILFAFAQPILWAGAYNHRDKNIPVLSNFESFWERQFYFFNDGLFEVVNPPNLLDQADVGKRVAKITYFAGRWPTFKIQRVYPDWRGYDFVAFDLYNAESERIRMTFRVDDKDHNYTNQDRFDHRFWAVPGLNQIRLPLDAIRTAPTHREMDMSQIKDIMWSANQVTEARRVYLDNVRLE